MALVKQYAVEANLKVLLELSEEEVKALDGIFGYDVEVFLKVFYEKMGKHYVEPYENGVRSLHKTIRGAVGGPIEKINEAKRLLYQAKATV